MIQYIFLKEKYTIKKNRRKKFLSDVCSYFRCHLWLIYHSRCGEREQKIVYDLELRIEKESRWMHHKWNSCENKNSQLWKYHRNDLWKAQCSEDVYHVYTNIRSMQTQIWCVCVYCIELQYQNVWHTWACLYCDLRALSTRIGTQSVSFSLNLVQWCSLVAACEQWTWNDRYTF